MASEFIAAAINSFEQKSKSAECSRFNPANAYGLQGHLYGTLALFMANEGQIDSAIDFRHKAIAAYSSSTNWLKNQWWVKFGKGLSQTKLADLLAQQGKQEEAFTEQQNAVKSYSEALNIRPTYCSANYNRGLVYLSLKEWPAMFADFDTIIKAEPENYGAYLYRGIASARMSKKDQAENDFRKVLELTKEPFYINRAKEELQKLGVTP